MTIPRTTSLKMGWNFDNSYARLPSFFFTKQDPTPVRSPQWVVFNDFLAQSLGLNVPLLQREEGAALFAGNVIPAGAEPIAQAYAGHQFGQFTMLGDGRAVLLGEQITPQGKRYDVVLKGSGPTPYSRGGDGRAVLAPMLREYIISEAMHALGIPTTRSLAVVETGETVMRETGQSGAVLTRIATSHLRVGTFEYTLQWGDDLKLKALADYTIERHYPHCANEVNPYVSLLHEVIQQQAALVVKWQLIGFVHGVMNTDNMTLSGETIDYGPCAFMDVYNPSTVFSSIDVNGRYAYGNQPYITAWNLARFAEALLPLLDKDKDHALKLAEAKVGEFPKIYQEKWLSGMRAKLGLCHAVPQDEQLITDLLNMMHQYKADFTNTFRALTLNKFEDISMFNTDAFNQWFQTWQDRLRMQRESKQVSQQLMRTNNPSVIPRNHLVEQALQAANKGDYSVMSKLLAVLSDPYAYSSEQESYTIVPETDQPYRTYCGT